MKWEDIARRASNEQDPSRLVKLTEELIEALDGEAEPARRPTAADPMRRKSANRGTKLRIS